MRRWSCYLAAVLGLISLGNVHAATESIDFNTTTTVAVGELITNQFSDRGILFKNAVSNSSNDIFLPRRTPLRINSTNYPFVGLRSGYEAGLYWGFVDPVTNAPRGVDAVTVKSYGWGIDHYGPDILKAYDASGNLLDSAVYSGEALVASEHYLTVYGPEIYSRPLHEERTESPV